MPPDNGMRGWRAFLARVANLSVLCVSSACALPGVTVHTTAMRAPEPVSEDASTRVSLESRKGTCAALPSASLAITPPSASSERLMKLPSLVCQRVVVACRVGSIQGFGHLLGSHLPHAYASTISPKCQRHEGPNDWAVWIQALYERMLWRCHASLKLTHGKRKLAQLHSKGRSRTRADSEPARSMRCSADSVRTEPCAGSAARALLSMLRRRMVCERELPSFNAVALVCAHSRQDYDCGLPGASCHRTALMSLL